MVDCRAAVNVDAVCQRCLEAFRLPVEVEVTLLLLGIDEDADGYDECEVWELQEKLLRPRDIVEELLVMALPLSAMHTDSSSCRALTRRNDDGEMTTPFAALREQMERNR